MIISLARAAAFDGSDGNNELFFADRSLKFSKINFFCRFRLSGRPKNLAEVLIEGAEVIDGTIQLLCDSGIKGKKKTNDTYNIEFFEKMAAYYDRNPNGEDEDERQFTEIYQEESWAVVTKLNADMSQVSYEFVSEHGHVE